MNSNHDKTEAILEDGRKKMAELAVEVSRLYEQGRLREADTLSQARLKFGRELHALRDWYAARSGRAA